jgi:hypothetical protein
VIYKPTSGQLPKIGGNSVFLAGSIEMGKAINWQTAAGEALSEAGFDVFNPRRDDWDSSWVQSFSNDQFREQVLWEMRSLNRCSNVLFHFEPDTQSPITLLELGLMAGLRAARGDKPLVVVHCPEGFWRKGNVDVAAWLFSMVEVDTIEDGIKFLQENGR